MATPPNPAAANRPQPTPIQSSPREVQITASQVQPPSVLYLQAEDRLRFTIRCPILPPPFNFNIICRQLRPTGEIVGTRKNIAFTADGQTVDLFLGEGFLLSATICGNPPSLFFQPGVFYVTLTVVRDDPDSFNFNWVLFADYATGNHFPTWPFGRNIFPEEGPGRLRNITGSTPAAGAEINEVVPLNMRWSLISFRMKLTTSAVVANRIPDILIDDGVNSLYKAGNNNPITASSTGTENCSNSGYASVSATNDDKSIPIPSLLLLPGFRIRSQTLAIDVGDQWSAPQYLVQEWITT